MTPVEVVQPVLPLSKPALTRSCSEMEQEPVPLFTVTDTVADVPTLFAASYAFVVSA
jgi:hypothetical protein